MKAAFSTENAFRCASVFGASLVVMAASAGPAFAVDSGTGVPTAAPTVMAQSALLVPALPCQELPCNPDNAWAEEGGGEPGDRSDPGWGVSNHIGEGGGGAEDDPDNPDRQPASPTIGGARSITAPHR
jgi:hypothetical protein